jgi:hypothetical protein
MTAQGRGSRAQKVPIAAEEFRVLPIESLGVDDAVSWSHCLGKKFNACNIAGFMFKVMHLSDISLLDDLFPQTGPQTPQLSNYSTVSHRIFNSGASAWCPAPGDRVGCINIRVKIQWHPCSRKTLVKRHSQSYQILERGNNTALNSPSIVQSFAR